MSVDKNLFFFYGEESFLLEEKVLELSAPFSEKEVFEGKEADLNKLALSLSSVSLFSSEKVVWVKNPVFLGKGIEGDELKVFDRFLSLALEGPHRVIVFVLGEKLDQRRKAVVALKKSASVQEFSAFKDWEQDQVEGWAQRRVKSVGKAIDQDALTALVQMGGQNLRYLAAEIEKLKTYVGDKTQIKLEDVHASSGGVSARWFSFNEAFKTADVKGLLRHSAQLMEAGEDPIKLMGGTHATLKFYFQMMALDAQGCDLAKMAQLLGKNPYFLKQVFPFVKKKYSLAKLKSLYASLNQKDIGIKSGQIDPEVALELVLTEVGR